MCEKYLLNDKANFKDSNLKEFYKVWIKNVNENIANIFIDVDDFELEDEDDEVIFKFLF